MDMNDLVIVSVDDHIIEPPDMWDNHLSAQHKAIAPRMVRDATADYWITSGDVMAMQAKTIRARGCMIRSDDIQPDQLITR